jgi:hypothetical protein
VGKSSTSNTANGKLLRKSSMLRSIRPKSVRKVRLISNKYYLLPSNSLIKILSINYYFNHIIVYNFTSSENENIEIPLAERILVPVFKVNEVALALGRKTETIRRYERDGILPKARQVRTGQRGWVRVYTREEVEALADFFEERSVGRPSKRPTERSSVNRKQISVMFNKMIEEK